MSRAVFLDRDGVVNRAIAGPEGLDSPRSVHEFQLLPGAARAIRRLNDLQVPVVLVSNQPGIAKGKFAARDLDAITERMRAELNQESAVLDGIYYCLHHPEAVLAEYRVACDCRKPKPGLLVRAAREMGLTLAGSYMLGDQARDMVAGKSAGCTTVFIGSRSTAAGPIESDYFCDDLSAAVTLLVALENADQLSQTRR